MKKKTPTSLAKQYRLENIQLKQDLIEANNELHKTNSELMQLTLELDEQVANRTRALQKSEAELRRHRDHLQDMVNIRTHALQKVNQTLEQKINELAVSEEHFRGLVATVPDIVYQIDENGHFTFINNAIKKLGYEPAELINQHFTRIIADDYHPYICRQSILRKFSKTQKSKTPIQLFDERRTGDRKTTGLEIQLLNKASALLADGTTGFVQNGRTTVEVNSAGIYTQSELLNQKSYVGTVGVIRDITTRKQLETGLRLAKESLEKKVEQRTEELTRKNRESLLEIQRRIMAEKRSNHAKKQWQNIFEAIGHTTLILDKDRNILAANRAASAMTGRSQSDLIGKKCFKILHDSENPIRGCPFDDLVKSGDTDTKEAEFTINNRNLIISCTPVYDDDNKLLNVIHIATDITKTKKLEKDLHQAQKMESLGTLAGGIAHDFNNVLTVMMGFAQISMSGNEDDKELVDNLKQICNAGLHARDLISQILTFARRSDNHRQPIKVSSISKEILKLLRSTIPTSIKIIGNIHSDYFVNVNPTHIHQILMNLATNGIQAMENGEGTLHIHIYDYDPDSTDNTPDNNLLDQPCVVIKVNDSGKGIPSDDLEHIFDPYFTTKAQGKGTGLGLSVVHGIVKTCNGKISVISEVQNGTTFTICLPALNQIACKPARPDTSIPKGSEHVYVVDDDPVVTDMICRMLENLGYHTSASTSSMKALEEIRNNHENIDLILSDVTMPELTGDRLTLELRKYCPDIPVILHSGYSARLTKDRLKEIGVKAVLMKPMTIERLAQTVRNTLDESTNRLDDVLS